MLYLYFDESGDLGFYFVNKNERASQVFCVGAFANRWMGTLRTTCNGLTARG